MADPTPTPGQLLIMNKYAFTLIFEINFSRGNADFEGNLIIDLIKHLIGARGEVVEYCAETSRLTADIIYKAENADIAENHLTEVMQQYYYNNNLTIIRINDYD